MRSLFQVVVLACCLFGAIPVGSIPTKDCAYKLKEEISPPRGWVKHGDAPANRKIALKFALPQSKFSELEKHLYEVSDPDHHRYGQHLSKEEVEELVAPHPESLNTVNNWLASLGFADEDIVRSPAKDWITIKVPISMAEQILNTVRLYLQTLITVLNFPWNRNIMFGNTSKVAITLLEPRATLYQAISMIILSSYNPPPCSAGSNRKNRLFSRPLPFPKTLVPPPNLRVSLMQLLVSLWMRAAIKSLPSPAYNNSIMRLGSLLLLKAIRLALQVIW